MLRLVINGLNEKLQGDGVVSARGGDVVIEVDAIAKGCGVDGVSGCIE